MVETWSEDLGDFQEMVTTHDRLFGMYFRESPHTQEGRQGYNAEHNFGGRLPDDHMLQR